MDEGGPELPSGPRVWQFAGLLFRLFFEACLNAAAIFENQQLRSMLPARVAYRFSPAAADTCNGSWQALSLPGIFIGTVVELGVKRT